MYSASTKQKLEAAATVAASFIFVAIPTAVVAAIARHEERLARQARRAAATRGMSRDATCESFMGCGESWPSRVARPIVLTSPVANGLLGPESRRPGRDGRAIAPGFAGTFGPR